MKYQIIANILFDDEESADKLYKEIEKLTSKVYKNKGNEEIDASSSCQKFYSYHDEIPPKQCIFKKSIQFNIEKEGEL